MTRGDIGALLTPRQGYRAERIAGVPWAADNGCFSEGDTFSMEKFLAWLERQETNRARCKFAVAPDVLGDAEATLARSLPEMDVIRELGYPAALVGQDGLTPAMVPWDAIDAFFIGGSTEWKLSDDARAVVDVALEEGKWVHMGRVNTRGRVRYAHDIGCDSVDGTFLAFGPDVNLPRLLRWMGECDVQGRLF